MELQNDLLEFKQMFTHNGKFCSLCPHWQARVIEYLDRCACNDDMVNELSSAASSMNSMADGPMYTQRGSHSDSRMLMPRSFRLLT
mmetsp:Transcript_15889/g.26611  ORF Transcript_15889/g.26611 Transcript_15889/m.26611 type:complete len:86 (+) Transcript_15889:2-259(+)